MDFENERHKPIFYPKEFGIRYLGIPMCGFKTLREFEEMEHRLIQVSGFDMEKLIELFAAGYTLNPPKYNRSLKLLCDFEEEDHEETKLE